MRLPRIKLRRALGTITSPVISKNQLYLLLRSHWQIYSTHQLKQASFQITGNQLELHQSLRRVKKLKSRIIVQFLFNRSLQGYLKNFVEVASQLYKHMMENDYFSPDQSGFFSLHSTVTSLLTSTDDWYKGLDIGKLVGLVFIDMKKAFDTVDHDIVCKKLEHYGIQGRELALFKSYLCNRKKYSKVNGVDSSIEDIEIGVPQGSCLKPFFIPYIH